MNLTPIARLAVLTFTSPPAIAQNAERRLEHFTNNNNTLEIATSDGRYLVKPYSANIVETTFIPKGEKYEPASHAVVLSSAGVPATVNSDARRIQLVTPGITVTVEKQPFRISYAYKGRPLVAEKLGYVRSNEMDSIEFSLGADEALYGAGARAVGMDRLGNTGLIDLYKPEARDWFWNIYKGLKNGGVGGWWGDLGEPEVHPSALQHATGSADQVHNVYGHDWARLIAEGYAKDFPNERPFILMRAGYSGSQRFGLIPWPGDVSRGLGGLQSQMEISLQMGMQGLAYMHSDLGGFAGATLDDELYVRWLQYGVFQPVFRPHAQEDVPPEPVLREAATRALARDAIRLRYGSTWFDFYTDKPHRGGITQVIATAPDRIPVFVRAGAFIPMAKVVQSTRDYSTRHIDLHYYHDASVTSASGKLYDDDGETARAYERGQYEIVRFVGKASAGKLEISLHTDTGKAFKPVARGFALLVHNIRAKPRTVSIGARSVPFKWNAQRKLLEVNVRARQRQAATVAIGL